MKEITITDNNDFSKDVLGKVYTKLFGFKDNGYFVEIGVGRCLPPAGSNTANLADIGWTGVCIEPNTNYIDEIKTRHKDNNVKIYNYAAGSENRTTYIKGDTLDKETYNSFKRVGWYEEQILNENPVEVKEKITNEIFEEAKVPAKFDLLTVDVEGWEYEVIKSIDFAKYRPLVVLLEVRYNDPFFVRNFPELAKTSQQSVDVLLNNGYRPVYQQHDNPNQFFICDLLGGAVLQ
jgi:FkbM family methyltransferase|tara:strand:+ start:765 stop:1466 length:702 start_codon:yes stop_codon:yes gene_type:complete